MFPRPAFVGASIASYLLQPKQIVSLGASGAVFGLFVVSVLCKLSFNPRKLLECAILGQFVMQQVVHVSQANHRTPFGRAPKPAFLTPSCEQKADTKAFPLPYTSGTLKALLAFFRLQLVIEACFASACLGALRWLPLQEAKMQLGTKGAVIAGTRVGHLAHLFGEHQPSLQVAFA